MTRAIWIWRKWVSMLCGYATTPSLPLTSNHTWVLCFPIPNPLRRTYQTGTICVWGKSATTVLLCVCVCVCNRALYVLSVLRRPQNTLTHQKLAVNWKSECRLLFGAWAHRGFSVCFDFVWLTCVVRVRDTWVKHLVVLLLRSETLNVRANPGQLSSTV